jgi:hypothetical protein
MGDGLTRALEEIPIYGTGEEAEPDSLGTSAPVEGAQDEVDTTDLQTPPEEKVREEDKEGQQEPEPEKEAKPEGEGDEATKRIEEMKELAKPQEGDSALIKSLREALDFRLETQQPPATAAPELSDRDREAIDLVTDLYGFDEDRGYPTTRAFVEKVATRDGDLAGQLMWDVANTQLRNADRPEGWTYGHEFLSRMGLDPNKVDELAKFSRGEISGEQYGVVSVPQYIPPEYQEAYKQLDEVSRIDVDIYLQSESPNQKAAGLQRLMDRQAIINTNVANQQRYAQENATFEQVVSQEVDTQLVTTYNTMLDTIKQNPAYKEIKVSGDGALDSMIKDTIISNVTALGDDNSVLAKRAAEGFEKAGIKIDLPALRGLLQQIEADTRISVRADRRGKAENRDFSVQVQEALKRRSDNVAKALAIGNRVFSESLKKFSATPFVKGKDPKGAEPNLGGGKGQLSGQGGRQTENGRPGAMSPAELDAMVLNTARGFREGQ